MKVKERAHVLDMLEVAEARYIQAGRTTPSPSLKYRPDPDSKSSKATAAEVPDLGELCLGRLPDWNR